MQRATSGSAVNRRRDLGLVLVLAASCVFGATTASAAINYDGFDYSGTTLNGSNGGTGWNGGWIQTGSSTSQNLSNDSTSLSYPGTWEPPLSTPSTAGARVSTGGLAANASSSRLLANTIPLNVDGTVAYASALVRKNVTDGAVTNDNVLLEFVDSNGNRRWGFGIEGTGDKPWLNANGSTTAATTVTAGDTYFLVAKIVSSASGTDTAFLKVFGTGYASQVPMDEPTTWDATLTQTTGAILDRVRVRIDVGNPADAPGEVDEIRVGDSWASVAVVPEPASLALLGPAAVAALRRRRRQRGE